MRVSRNCCVKVNRKMDIRGIQIGMGGKVYLMKPEQNMISMYSYVYVGNNVGGVG